MPSEFDRESHLPQENLENSTCEASMPQGTGHSGALSRRAAIGVLGAGAVLLKSGMASAQAQAPARLGPPSTVTTPPRDFGPGARRPPTSPTPTSSPSSPRSTALRAAQCADPAPVDGRAVVGGAGVEQPGALSRLERHPQQPPAPLARGRRPRQRVPQPVEQQQRQHLRLPGPPALLRAPHAPRRPLRARRLGHRDRRRLQRQAAQLAQRRGAASRRQLLVHRPAVRRPALRGRARTRRAGPAMPRGGSIRGSASRRDRATAEARAADELLPRRPERPRRPRRERGAGARSERPRASRPTTRSSTS